MTGHPICQNHSQGDEPLNAGVVAAQSEPLRS